MGIVYDEHAMHCICPGPWARGRILPLVCVNFNLRAIIFACPAPLIPSYPAEINDDGFPNLEL